MRGPLSDGALKVVKYELVPSESENGAKWQHGMKIEKLGNKAAAGAMSQAETKQRLRIGDAEAPSGIAR